MTPHVVENQNGRRSAIDGRTTRHPGYAVSQRIRKRIEEVFGWAKTVAGLRKMRHRGLPKVDWQFALAMAAYDFIRLPKSLAEPRRDPGPSARKRGSASATSPDTADPTDVSTTSPPLRPQKPKQR